MANADYLVVEDDGAIVGVTLSVFDGFTSFVGYMAVDLGKDRPHLGRRMIEELARRTRARDGANIVVASWLSAAGLYYAMEIRMPGAVSPVREVRMRTGGSRRRFQSDASRARNLLGRHQRGIPRVQALLTQSPATLSLRQACAFRGHEGTVRYDERQQTEAVR